MPEIGAIKQSGQIGKTGRAKKFIWTACSDCGKERWVAYRVKEKQPVYSKCVSCVSSGPRRGLKYKQKNGYILVWLFPNNPFYPMRLGNCNRVAEHRLMMAKSLGRCLGSDEFVHHLNGIRNDNRIENLCLTTNKLHHNAAFTMLQNEIRNLQTQVRNQAIRIRKLEIINTKLNSSVFSKGKK